MTPRPAPRVAGWGQHAGAFTDQVEEQMHDVDDRRLTRVGSRWRAFAAVTLGLGLGLAASACGPDDGIEVSASPTSVGSHAPTVPSTSVSPSAPVDCARRVDQVALLERSYRRLDGVDPSLLTLDVFGPLPPAGCPAVPVVIDVHGGDFGSGDKSDHLDAKVAVLNGAGYAVVSINHRLVGDAGSGPGGGGYPAQAKDVAAAVAWVMANVERFSGDPARIAMIGSTAGAFLAAQQVTEPSHLAAAGVDPATIRCAALLDPEPLDVVAEIEAATVAGDRYADMFGEAASAASPQRGAADGTVVADILVLTRGADDRSGPAVRFAAAAQLAGVDVSVVDAAAAGDDIEAALGAAGDRIVTPAVLDFLDRCLV
jgi:acetyl esterase/lipase